MWLFTDTGFYSVAEVPPWDKKLPEATEELVVRARVKADLDRLRERYMPGLGPSLTTPNCDYRFRAYVSRKELARGYGRMAAQLDYHNFKNTVRTRMGAKREEPLHRIWSIMHALQRRPRWRPEPIDEDAWWERQQELSDLADRDEGVA